MFERDEDAMNVACFAPKPDKPGTLEGQRQEVKFSSTVGASTMSMSQECREVYYYHIEYTPYTACCDENGKEEIVKPEYKTDWYTEEKYCKDVIKPVLESLGILNGQISCLHPESSRISAGYNLEQFFKDRPVSDDLLKTLGTSYYSEICKNATNRLSGSGSIDRVYIEFDIILTFTGVGEVRALINYLRARSFSQGAKLFATKTATGIEILSREGGEKVAIYSEGALKEIKFIDEGGEILGTTGKVRFINNEGKQAESVFQLIRKEGEIGFRRAGSFVKEADALVTFNKLIEKVSSENILWKNLDETNIIWANQSSNVLSTAKTFANETGTSLYDAVLSDGYYVKFDLIDGRILLGNTNCNYHGFAVVNDASLGSFKSSVLNVSDDVFNTKLSQYLSVNADKLKVLSGVVSEQLTIAGKIVTLSTSKVNTILGKFRPDIVDIFEELGSFKNVGLGETKGGINLLNKPDHYYDPVTWWNAYNKPWLDKAINRGDDIYLSTIPTKADDIFRNGQLVSTYAEELNHLVIRNYKPVNISVTEWSNIKAWLGY